MGGYTVLDFETTGLFPNRHDRVVEMGVVYVAEDGHVQGEWTTLVNPQRDVGPTYIHGIAAREVLDAPTFAELAPYVLRSVAGRTVVAHNVSFDLRFLLAELAHCGYPVSLRPPGLCTMQWSGRCLHASSRKLVDCCRAAGIEHGGPHEASHDARAVAGLLAHYLRVFGSPTPWADLDEQARAHPWPEWADVLPPVNMVARSTAAPRRPEQWLDRIVAGMPRNPDVRVESYLEVLESALLDRYLSRHEEEALVETATDLGLGRDDLDGIHRDYLRSMAAVALADGVVTKRERGDLDLVASLLGLAGADVDAALARARQPERVLVTQLHLKPGDSVCLTGQMAHPRADLTVLIEARGMLVGGLTRDTRILVAADPDSQSGKAKKARSYGVPVITEQALLGLLLAMNSN